MPLTPGTRIGTYEIVSPIGAGGMGEVYRARDNLKREVALKVLPDQFTSDPERLVRFQREAEILAALNHPGIATIYGFVEVAGVRAIAMEFVDGPVLTCPQPLETAVGYARQIAEALEYAHDRGILHRDLKPANIRLTADGKVKLLDFGLAKAMEEPSMPGSDPRALSTLTLGHTEAGVIMGTPAYMSPEQASGLRVDKRADIWSFGVVLWEMLSGRRLFSGGDTIAHMLADVLRAEIDFSRITAPRPVADLLKRCLDRDVRTRLRDIGEARVTLSGFRDGAETLPEAPTPITKASKIVWGVAAAALIAMAPLSYVAWRHSSEEPPRLVRLSFPAPEKGVIEVGDGPNVAVSPDGRRVAFLSSVEGMPAIWVRELDSPPARMLAGTEGSGVPFWAPDSRRLGFVAGGKLKKIDIASGPPVSLADASNGGGTWNRSDVILFSARTVRIIQRISAAGGTPTPVSELDQSKESVHLAPWFLPDGRHFLYLAAGSDAPASAVYVGDLESKGRTQILAGATNVQYDSGYLLFMRDRSLLAQEFDAGKLKLIGEPKPVTERLAGREGGEGAYGYFSAGNGVLAYVSGVDAAQTQLTWFDRAGKRLGNVGPPGDLEAYSLASDDASVVVARRDPQTTRFDLWRYDLERGTGSRLTFGANNRWPVYSADGSRVFYVTERNQRDGESELKAEVASVASNGSGEPEVVSELHLLPQDASRDGRYLFFTSATATPKTSNDLWVQPLTGADRKPFAYLTTVFREGLPRLSPDGRWLAYNSNESKRAEVYVISFPVKGGKWQISTNGGGGPFWSHDGRELYFYSVDRKIMAVDIKSGAQFSAGVPHPLFEVPLNTGNTSFSVSKIGRFLLPVLTGENSAAPMSVILNWPQMLNQR